MRTCVLALSFFAALIRLQAQELKPHTLVVFKSGIAWIEHRGTVSLSDGWGVIPRAPEAVIGTVSLTSENGPVDELRTVGSARTSSATIDALLQRAIGKTVTIHDGTRELSGRILRGGSPILLESGRKTIAIERMQIASVTFEGLVAHPDDQTPSLRFRAKGAHAALPIRYSYVRQGLAWFPDYSIVLDGKGRAALTMRATLVNDGEDLRDTDVLFAVGIPNFSSSHIESPLSTRQSLAELLRLFGVSPQAARIMINAANVYENSSQEVDFNPTTIPDPEGERAEDLYFYTRKGVTLAKEERAAFLLHEVAADYEDLYTLELERGSRPTPSPAETVWHSVRLTNATSVPWTTAPALVLVNGRPLAQSTLRYAPAGGTTTIRMTVANDVIAKRSEAEVARARESVRRFGNSWDIATIEGTIEVRNLKKNAITLAITREIEGEAIRSATLRVTRIAAQPRAMNPIEELRWEVALGGGETKTITYQYKVYVTE